MFAFLKSYSEVPVSRIVALSSSRPPPRSGSSGNERPHLDERERVTLQVELDVAGRDVVAHVPIDVRLRKPQLHVAKRDRVPVEADIAAHVTYHHVFGVEHGRDRAQPVDPERDSDAVGIRPDQPRHRALMLRNSIVWRSPLPSGSTRSRVSRRHRRDDRTVAHRPRYGVVARERLVNDQCPVADRYAMQVDP